MGATPSSRGLLYPPPPPSSSDSGVCINGDGNDDTVFFANALSSIITRPRSSRSSSVRELPTVFATRLSPLAWNTCRFLSMDVARGLSPVTGPSPSSGSSSGVTPGWITYEQLSGVRDLMHCEHGAQRSHLSLRRRQVIHDRGGRRRRLGSTSLGDLFAWSSISIVSFRAGCSL